MAHDRGIFRRKSPRWLPLLLDVVLVTLSLLLDVRDLWFKLQWMGPHDTFAFSTVETRYLPASDAALLQPTTSFSYSDQKLQRASGWSSFLEKCSSLTPLLEEDTTRVFRYAVGRNCEIGKGANSVRAELFLTSSIRVDSMAWIACELLYKHRKPPICHSPIVTQFRERYNFHDELSFRAAASSTAEYNGRLKGSIQGQETYATIPGSDDETELIELLEVISKSSPVFAAVCVEGFIVKGSGRYTASIYGCGSPSFHRSFLLGSGTPMMSQFLRDKAWLMSSSLDAMGMTFLIRENRQSIFTVYDSARGNSNKLVEHRSLVNVSTSGSLYITMVLVDLILLALTVCSVVEISLCMLWPLWKPLVASEYQTSSAWTTKMGFGVKDYTQVLQIGLLSSVPVALLTVISRFLAWMLVIPSVNLWSDGNIDAGDTHAFLTMVRFCDVVAVCVNVIWGAVVAFDEKRTLAFVRQTYVSPLEITTIGLSVSFIGVHLGGSEIYGAMQHQDRQRLIDRTSFENVTALSNAFFVHQTTSIVPLDIYYPLLATTGISVLVVGILTVSRFRAGKSVVPRSLVQSISGSVSAAQPSTAKCFPLAAFCAVPNDLTSNTAGILMRSVPPLLIPTREELVGPSSSTSSESAYLGEINDGRIHAENMVDIPMRALSLVRRSWALEKMTDCQLVLLPASYLKYGIVLAGKSMKTRCGFMDVVQPLVHAQEHTNLGGLENELQQRESSYRPNLR